jgi:hypothetical protein
MVSCGTVQYSMIPVDSIRIVCVCVWIYEKFILFFWFVLRLKTALIDVCVLTIIR